MSFSMHAFPRAAALFCAAVSSLALVGRPRITGSAALLLNDEDSTSRAMATFARAPD